MRRLRNNQSGLILTLIIIGVIVGVAYFTLQNFLSSEQGQQLQDTTNKVLDTIDGTDE